MCTLHVCCQLYLNWRSICVHDTLNVFFFHEANQEKGLTILTVECRCDLRDVSSEGGCCHVAMPAGDCVLGA